MQWKFEDPQNTAVITSRRILSKINGILEVWHDADDGMWQFLDGNEIHEGDAVMVSLKEIVTIDSSVNLLSNLPLVVTLGEILYRKNGILISKHRLG